MVQQTGLNDSRDNMGHCPHSCHRSWAQCRYVRWLWPILGLCSLGWFLVRVIPKPSRAVYPCQRIAFPLASTFVLWLAGLAGSAVAFHHARRHLVQARIRAGVLFWASVLVSYGC